MDDRDEGALLTDCFGSVAAGPLLSCVLDYRTIGFQALRQPLGRSAMGWEADPSEG